MVIHKPLGMPPEVARAFFKAMKDYFAEQDGHKRDTIASHQLDILRRYDKNLRLSDVREMFEQMRAAD